MTNSTSQGDLLGAQLDISAHPSTQAPAPCHLDHLAKAVKEFQLIKDDSKAPKCLERALKHVPHEGLRKRVEALVRQAYRAAFVEACAKALASSAYGRAQTGATTTVLLASAELAAESVADQWSLAPWHHLKGLPESRLQALCEAVACSTEKNLPPLLLNGTNSRNIYIAMTASDDLPTYIRRCQLITNRLHPLYLVLDADIVDQCSDATMREITSTLGIPGFYISTRTKDQASEATPLRMHQVTGATGVAYLHSDGTAFDPLEAPASARARTRKAATAPTTSQADQINSLSSSRRPAPKQAAATSTPSPSPTPNPGAAPTSQRSRLDAIRQRQALSKT